MPRNPDLPCNRCGELMWRGTTSLPEGQARCGPCRRANWEHGTRKGYRDNACRCDRCAGWARAVGIKQRQRLRDHLTTSPECSDPTCSRPSTSRGMCTMHYKRWARANGMRKSPSDGWSDLKKSNYHARRARMGGTGKRADRVLVSDLVAQGRLTCGWCDQPIDPTLAYPAPLSKSLDHTVPISKGGAHTLDNCTLMHLVCNLRKGATYATRQDAS